MKKKFSLMIAIVSMFFLISSNSNAATFTIAIDQSVPLFEIQTFQIFLDVTPDFTFSSFSYGSAIPTSGTLKWDSLASVNGGKFKISGGDKDGLFLGTPYDMEQGILATFNYTGAVIGVDEAALQFSNHSGINQWAFLRDVENVTYNLSGDALTFSAVPVPSSLFLLGGGLFALVGITRRKK